MRLAALCGATSCDYCRENQNARMENLPEAGLPAVKRSATE
jgi:hypothetical protein